MHRERLGKLIGISASLKSDLPFARVIVFDKDAAVDEIGLGELVRVERVGFRMRSSGDLTGRPFGGPGITLCPLIRCRRFDLRLLGLVRNDRSRSSRFSRVLLFRLGIGRHGAANSQQHN